MNTFTTDSMYVAAALHATGCTLAEVTPGHGGRRVFHFEDPKGQVQTLFAAYIRGTMPAPQPRALFDSLYQVRKAMYAVQG